MVFMPGLVLTKNRLANNKRKVCAHFQTRHDVQIMSRLVSSRSSNAFWQEINVIMIGKESWVDMSSPGIEDSSCPSGINSNDFSLTYWQVNPEMSDLQSRFKAKGLLCFKEKAHVLNMSLPRVEKVTFFAQINKELETVNEKVKTKVVDEISWIWITCLIRLP